MENISFINVDSRKYIELTPDVEQALSAFFAQKEDTGNLKRKRESEQETEAKKKLADEQEAKRIKQAKKKSFAMSLEEMAATFDIPLEGKSGNVYVDIHVALKEMERSVWDDTSIWPWYEKLLDYKKALGVKLPPQLNTFIEICPYWADINGFAIGDEINVTQSEIIPLAYDSLNGIPNPLL